MSLQALAQEKFWANKAECEDAEKAYYMRLSGAKVFLFHSFFGSSYFLRYVLSDFDKIKSLRIIKSGLVFKFRDLTFQVSSLLKFFYF